MLRNYLVSALRNLRRRPFFSFINIAGLSIGLAACWLIGLFVQHERNYDTFLPYADRVCAVALDLKMGDEEGRTTNTPPPLGLRLAADFPEVESMARTFYLQEAVIRREEPGQAPLMFNENTAYAADTAFLELFGFPMVEGDASTALDHPGSLVLSEAMAEKYFGKTSPIGRPLLVNGRASTVTGVVRNLPSTSTVKFGFLLSMADFKVVDRFSWSWIWLQMDTWVRLRQKPAPESLAALEAKFPAMVRTHAPAAYERIGQNFEEQLRRGDRYDIKLLPLPSLHLRATGLASRLQTLGDGAQVQMFGLIGILILLLACVNFMNLSTARSMQRAREVGVRKALGSQRGALIGQFLSETLLYSSAAMLLATALTSVALPYFNQLTGYSWDFTDLFSPQLIGLVLALPLLTTVLGGLYPAFFLSKFKAGEVFKTAHASSKGGHASLRSGLVVFQFSVSIVLMLSSFVVYRQLEFAQTQSPGLERRNVLVIPMLRHFETPSAIESFRQQLLQLPEVATASHSTFLPSIGSFGDFYEPEQGNQSHAVVQNLLLSSFLTDADFVPTLGMELLSGRNFYPDNAQSDSSSVILNEAAVRAIGWENPLGKWMRYPGNQNQRFQVVGVVRDFHLGSIRSAIEPAAIFHESSKTYHTWASFMSVRLQPGAEKSAVEKVAACWKTTLPGVPFDFDFLDASFARLYRAEAKTASILSIFTGLALLIGCLGLFALAAFTAEQRTKEIGVRKVLGASVRSVVGLLSKDFLKLVLAALLIASPIAYWAMNKWLADFAYHIEMSGWMFAATGLTVVVIAFLSVGFQSVKAALTNPTTALKSECILLLGLFCQTAMAQQLPCIRSNVKTITYSINGKPTGNQWEITPELKPDIMGFGSTNKKWNRVVFYTDVDSFVCKAKAGKSYQFYILLNGKDSALTQIDCVAPIVPPAHFTKSYIAKNRGKSSFDIPEVQELAHIVMALTPTGIQDSNMVEHRTAYYEEVMAYFGQWKDHPVVKQMDALLSNDLYGHLKMDACGYVFKRKRLRKDGIYNRINWSSKNLIEPIVPALEDFAQKSSFRAFFKTHRAYYDRLLANAEKYMPIQPQWEWCEQEFPDRYDHYRITFSPLVNGWHCTNRFMDHGFKQTMMFICSAEGKSDLLPDKLWEARMTRVVLTEIDHNYVNPISERYISQIDPVFKNRPLWVHENLARGYGSPFSVFNEYMTWAVFSIYALEHYNRATFDDINARVEKQMVEWRGFLKFREFNQKMLELYRNRPQGKKVYELYPEILAWSANVKP